MTLLILDHCVGPKWHHLCHKVTFVAEERTWFEFAKTSLAFIMQQKFALYKFLLYLRRFWLRKKSWEKKIEKLTTTLLNFWWFKTSLNLNEARILVYGKITKCHLEPKCILYDRFSIRRQNMIVFIQRITLHVTSHYHSGTFMLFNIK